MSSYEQLDEAERMRNAAINRAEFAVNRQHIAEAALEEADQKLEKWDQEREDWIRISRAAEAERDAAVELLRRWKTLRGSDEAQWEADLDAFLAAQEKS